MELNLAKWEQLAYDRQLKSMGVQGLRMADLLLKADDPVVQATTGVYQTLYGARVYDNLYRQSTFWQVTPKVDFTTAKSGVRLKTADPANFSAITESAALGDTDKPDVIQYNMTLKRVNATWDITEMAQAKSVAENGKEGGEAPWMMQAMGDYFVSALDGKLDVQNGTLAGNFPESYDRIIGSKGEVDGNSDAADAAYSANDNDYLGNDRDAATTTDAQVGLAAANRALTIRLVENQILAAEKNGANRSRMVIVTGYDTFANFSALMSSQQRFDDYKEMTVGVNGVTISGRPTGFRAAQYQGVSILLDKQCVADASASSRMYGIDMDGVEFRLMNPVRHLSSPIENAILHDAFVERHSLDLAGELVATKFASHWKLRDLA